MPVASWMVCPPSVWQFLAVGQPPHGMVKRTVGWLGGHSPEILTFVMYYHTLAVREPLIPSPMSVMSKKPSPTTAPLTWKYIPTV